MLDILLLGQCDMNSTYVVVVLTTFSMLYVTFPTLVMAIPEEALRV